MARLRKNTNDNGILVSTAYCGSTEEKHRCKLFFAQLLLLVSSVLSGLFTFITSMDVELYNKTLILCTCVFATFFLFALTWNKISHITIISAVFILLLYLCERIEHYFEGIYHLENVVVKAFNDYFEESRFYYIVAQKDGRYDLTFLFVIISFLLCLVGALAIHRGRIQYGYLLLLLIAVIVPSVFGRLPNNWIFIVYVVSIFGLIELIAGYRGQKRYLLSHQQREHAMGISFTCMLVIAILIVGLDCGLRQEQYEHIPIPEWKESLTQSIEGVTSKDGGIDTGFPRKSNHSVGGLNGGELNLNNGRIRFNHKTQLAVKMTRPKSGVFLKGYAGVNYEGDSWSAATQRQIGSYQGFLNRMEKGEFIPDNYMIQQLGGDRMKTEGLGGMLPDGKLSIEYVNANVNYLYYPYYTWFDSSAMKKQKENAPLVFGEAYVKPTQRKRNYSMNFYETPKSFNELKESLGEQMDESILYYNEYVNDVYLTVPSEGLDRLKEEFSEYARQLRLMSSDEDTFDMVENRVSFVKNYLKNVATYTLTPGKTPRGQDYIEYFLYENHKGYCAHYASAATIMLRLLGVPARYVEGYYISDDLLDRAKVVEIKKHEEPQIEVQVDDSCAHAWVEVYMEGYGWYPVEVTGVSNEREEEQPTGTPTATPTPTPHVDKPTLEPTKTPEKERAEKIRRAPITQEMNPMVRVVLKIVTVVFVLTILAVGFHKYRKGYWGKYLRKHSINELCIVWYQCMLKLKSDGERMRDIEFSYNEEQYESEQSICIGKTYEEYDMLHSIYLKAVYSKEGIGEDELDLVKHKIQQEYYRYLIAHSRIRRIWHKFYMTLPF